MSALTHGMDWHVFPLSSHHSQCTWLSPVLPPSETNTELTVWIWAEWLAGNCIKRIYGYFLWETTADPNISIEVMEFHKVTLVSGLRIVCQDISFRNTHLASVTSSDKRIFHVLKYRCWGKFLMNTALEVCPV